MVRIFILFSMVPVCFGQMNYNISVYNTMGSSSDFSQIWGISTTVDDSCCCSHSSYQTMSSIYSPDGRSNTVYSYSTQTTAPLDTNYVIGDYSVSGQVTFNCACAGPRGAGGQTQTSTPTVSGCSFAFKPAVYTPACGTNQTSSIYNVLISGNSCILGSTCSTSVASKYGAIDISATNPPTCNTLANVSGSIYYFAGSSSSKSGDTVGGITLSIGLTLNGTGYTYMSDSILAVCQ